MKKHILDFLNFASLSIPYRGMNIRGEIICDPILQRLCKSIYKLQCAKKLKMREEMLQC